MDALVQDLRYALRLLVKSPTFAAIAVLTLAVGIGANVTVFSFVSALLLRPAPGVSDAASLVAIFTSDFSSGPYGESSYPDYESLESDASAFSAMAAEQGDVAVIRVNETAQRVRMALVTGNYFEVLGVRPAAGRLLLPADADAAAPPVAVIGATLWRRAFESNPGVVGSPLMINGRSYAIVGVAAEEFTGLDLGRGLDIWTPLVPPLASATSRGDRGYSIVARLRDGATLREAQSQVSAIATRLGREFPETNLGTLGAPDVPRPMTALRHTRLGPEFRGPVAMIGGVLMVAVALVLIIACANVAGLLLSRATARDREMAIRLALGAGRRRLVRQLLTESLVLGLAGGAFGLLLSMWTADALPSFFPAEQARMLDTAVDLRAFAFVLMVSLAASVLVGLAPAVQAARPAPAEALRNGSARLSESRTGHRLRRMLVSAQIAVAVVLLVSAALLVQSLVRAGRADFGFGTRNAALASVELPAAEVDRERALGYYREALERIRRLPGVEDAAFATVLPFNRPPRRGFRMEGYQPRQGQDFEHFFNVVTERYFETMKIPLLEGRVFDSRDRADSTPVAIVNDLVARRYFAGHAIGRRLSDSHGQTLTIVGVVRAGKNLTVQDPPAPLIYYPLAQSPEARMTLIARTAGDPSGSIEPVRRELAAVHRGVPVFRTITLASHIGESLAADRLTAVLVAACGAMALLLASVGVYGVIAFAVARRSREIGVRLALGASPAHVIRLVLGEGVGVTAGGLLVGLIAAAIASRGLSALLFGISASDPLTYVAIPIVLALVAMLAALIPARRALQLEPNTVLRQE